MVIAKMDAAPTKTQAGKGAVARLVKGRGGVEKHRGRRFPGQVAAGVGRGGKKSQLRQVRHDELLNLQSLTRGSSAGSRRLGAPGFPVL